MAETIAQLQAVITADTRGFEDGLSSTQKGLKGFGVAAGAAMSVATKAMDVAIDAAVGLAKSTVGAAVDWDKAFRNIESVTKRSTTSIQKQILNMRSAVAGPMELADAMYDIVGGVADASTHMAILEAANKTAEAGAANLKATTQGLISVMNSYKFSAKDAAFASDVLTQTVAKGVGSMDQFVAAMSPISGLAASLGVKFDDLGAAMAFMTTKGASAAQAGTQAQAAMTALIKPNAAMNDLLKKVNVSQTNATNAQGKWVTSTKMSGAEMAKTNDALAKAQAQLQRMQGKKNKDALDNYNISKKQAEVTALQSKAMAGGQPVKQWVAAGGQAQKVSAEWLIKTYGLVGALNKLKEAAGGSSQKMAEALGSVEALRAFVALTGGDFAEFEKDFKDSMTGATEAAREVQLKSVSAQFETFKNTLEGIALSIGSVVLPVLNGLFSFLNKGAEMVGRFGPIIESGIANIGKVFQPLLDEVNRVTAPLQAGIGNIKAAFDKFFSSLSDTPAQVIQGDSIADKIKIPGKSLAEKITPAFEELKATIAAELGKIDFIGIATGVLNAAASFGQELARKILLGVLDLGSRLISGLQAQFSGIDIGAAISTFLTNAQQTGMKFVDNLLSGLTDIVGKVGDAISGIDAVDIGSKAGKFLADALAFGGKIIGNLINGLLGIKSGVEGQVETQLNGVDLMSKAGTLVVKALQVGQQLIGKFMEGIASLGATLGNEIVKNLQSIDLGAAIQKLLTDAAANAQKLVGQFISGIGALGADFGGKIVENLNSIDVGAAAKQLLTGAGKIASDFITGAVNGLVGLGKALIDAVVAAVASIPGGAAKAAADAGAAVAASAIAGTREAAPAAPGQPGSPVNADGTPKKQGSMQDMYGIKGVTGGQRAGGGMNVLPGLANALIAQDQAGGADMAAQMQAQLDGAVEKLQPPAGLTAKLASFFSGADVTAALTNLGTVISGALATTFGADGAVMTALQPFQDSWQQIFGAGGTIAAAATGMQGVIDMLVGSIVNISGTGTPAILEFQAVSTSAAPTIAGAWQPVVGVFRQLLMTLEGIAGAAARATSAMGAIPGAGGVAGARAGGGAVARGQTYLVGENGPELFTAKSNGQIIPNGGTASVGGGGGGMNISGPINIYGVQNVNQMYDQLNQVARNRNAQRG